MCYPFCRKHGKHQAVNRREFITLIGGAASAWPLAARAQQSAIPVIGYLSVGAPVTRQFEIFKLTLAEAGLVEGRNVAIETPSANGQYDRLPNMAAEGVEVVRQPAGAADAGDEDELLSIGKISRRTPSRPICSRFSMATSSCRKRS